MPKVSVIIPNYNHALYLPKRIESVLSQTYRDLEVIILDDCSKDNSRDIITTYAAQDSRIIVCFNEQNSGIPFKQWNKGVSKASGEFIWIAESDDFADPHLLENLVPILEQNENVGIAYCQSYNIDENDQILSSRLEWTQDLDPERWKYDFINDGKEELKHYFLFKNTLPNASAVVIRRETYLKAGGAYEKMRLNGDKMTWTRFMLISDIGFCAKHLNFFRTHTNNVRSRTSYRNKLENFQWASFLNKKIDIPAPQKRKLLMILWSQWRKTVFNKRFPDFFPGTYSFIRYGKSIDVRLFIIMVISFLLFLPFNLAKLIYFKAINY